MRIAHVNADGGIAPGRRKGAAVHVEEMRRAFAGLGYEVVAIDTPRPDLVRTLLERAHAERPLDLVYERFALTGGAAIDFAAERGVPGVLEVNAPLEEEARRWRSEAGDLAGHERALGRSSLVLAVSRSVMDYCIRKGAPRDRVRLCPNAVDPSRFRPYRQEELADVPAVPAGRFVIGFHGRLRPWHNLPLLGRAAAELLGRGHEVHVLTVGDGPFADELVDLPEDRRTHVGWVAHGDVGRFVGRFDATALTYNDDGQTYFSPLKLYEAMACGVVPVVPDVGDLAEAVGAGRAGILYRAGSRAALVAALESVVTNPRLRSKLGAAAARTAGARTWLDVARDVLEGALGRGVS